MEGLQCLRKNALDRIAILAPNPGGTPKAAGIGRLQNGLPSGDRPRDGFHTLSHLPIRYSELEVLLALCEAAPLVQDIETAERLLKQLSPYLLEASIQAIAPSPFLHFLEQSPWEILSYQLVRAVISIGLRYPRLHSLVVETTASYLQRCLETVNAPAGRRNASEGSEDYVNIEDQLRIATLSVSLIGFLKAVSLYAHFYDTSEMLELVGLLRQILDENLMLSVEGVFSSIRTFESESKEILDWKLYVKRYATCGRPLGAMLIHCGYMRFLASCSSLQVATHKQLQEAATFDIIIADKDFEEKDDSKDKSALLESMSDITIESMRLLEDGADYLQLSSAWQQQLAFTAKAHSLHIYLNCMVADEDAADVDMLMSWLEDTMADPIQMADQTLSHVTLKSIAVIAKFSPSIASTLSHSLPRYVVQGKIRGESVAIAAQSLTYILQLLSQDAVITGLYSLGNVLSARAGADRAIGSSEVPNGSAVTPKHTPLDTQQPTGSAISLELSNEEDTAAAHGNIVRAIVSITKGCQEEKITALAQSMLLQKLGRVSLMVDLHIITEVAKLSTAGGPTEFRSLLKLYTRLSHEAVIKGNSSLSESVRDARLAIAKSLVTDSPLSSIFLSHLLETIVSKGDIHESDNSLQADVDLAAQEIVELLPAWAAVASARGRISSQIDDEDMSRLHREAWFNIVVHGITPASSYGRRYLNDLITIAVHSKPLIAEEGADQFESEIELNTVLRRGMNAPNTAEQKKRLISLLPRCESDIKGLSYPKVIFLTTAYLLETLRAGCGDCSHILAYFTEPSLNGSAMENCMRAIADAVLSKYFKLALSPAFRSNPAPKVAEQLAVMFRGCCNRIYRVQQVAALCADKIVQQMPSSLCQRKSLFALLGLLSIMWASCLEAELDEYEFHSHHVSARDNVSVELSDDYDLRKSTLNNLYRRAKSWVATSINAAPLDVKGLLQTYLSEYGDEGSYGHMSLGRSFALEMGSLVPTSDQRLSEVDRHAECDINMGSDFIAQYTTRQEYRFYNVLPDYDRERPALVKSTYNGDPSMDRSFQSAPEDQAIRAHHERPLLDRKAVSIEEMRDNLKRATALLCRSETDHCAIIGHLVSVPFSMFTKQSIKLGVSLWLGAINENPRTESRILAEIAENWEMTVLNRVGAFSPRLRHNDPFCIKEEFAPSERAELARLQQAAHNLLAPHLRLLQFLSSHFQASRLASLQSQRVFYKIIMTTIQGLTHSFAHPLAREFYFQAVLFGLNVLRYCAGLGQSIRWKLKDAILSAALSWFSYPPRWSYGGNRLQVKAEVRLVADVKTALTAVSASYTKANGRLLSTINKQDLLYILLEDEEARLGVWLYPFDHERRHVFAGTSNKAPTDSVIVPLVRAAWIQDPSLAIQLASRFTSPKVASEVRSLLLRFPEKAIGYPEALQVLIGTSMPPDVQLQLKYLLYWAPVNPVTAVTYFLPDYRNDPFIIQYAMRALEHHSVDVTFFYVPQIVQTLRYDVLGYVQRYIIETAKFSQLFAHQIIWNMTANAYKDEDSSIEDSLKPTLDIVKDRMIAGFSEADKAFYEREFSFFGEITGISGKLRPFIKKSKPEKKQKIEEELRQIRVEVGVYLPSNPDGTVIGIDRKSGKPLQSHAKAPYMATFRIKKSHGGTAGVDDMLGKTNQNDPNGESEAAHQESTFEVWQSAIFKVGDDCRQDVLALQMIAAFRGIFNNVGLDVYVYPYRVTATAPGCGVIDVLPNSISRDMLGREAVNGLYDYFISKYGAETSIKFQEARNNFVKSMAAYSVISYLLQFKDRHNGNIMVDDAGHILHIDFGFCFDIAPGRVRFERAPFKLTSEMVAVMGGSTHSQSYKWFEELCIKAFLASRQHTEKLCHIVVLMLGSGLPCFKPETITHLRQRFVLEKNEREAADFMRDLVKKSQGSYSTKGYDQFQLLTNGIPY
ncbi:Phosphatidylinositol 4-kinase stt4 [Lecanora helva]